jgi:hypothetical protein
MIQTQTGNALLIPHSQGTVIRMDFFFKFIFDCFNHNIYY